MGLRLLGVLVLAGLSLPAAGCAFDAQILVRFHGISPTVVTESVKPQQIPHRVEGVTRRRGQILRFNCSVTLVYDVREATGSAVLAQTFAVKLRTPSLRRGIAYSLDCLGPLVVELPADASGVGATATDAASLETALPVQARVMSIPIAFGRRLRPEPNTQFAVVEWPRTLPAGSYQVELSFSLPRAQPIREKAIYTASVSCGRSRYLQPILPPVTTIARAPTFTIRPSADPITFSLPRVAGALGSYAEAKRTLSCVR
jgi:hypothetical protein